MSSFIHSFHVITHFKEAASLSHSLYFPYFWLFSFIASSYSFSLSSDFLCTYIFIFNDFHVISFILYIFHYIRAYISIPRSYCLRGWCYTIAFLSFDCISRRCLRIICLPASFFIIFLHTFISAHAFTLLPFFTWHISPSFSQPHFIYQRQSRIEHSWWCLAFSETGDIYFIE